MLFVKGIQLLVGDTARDFNGNGKTEAISFKVTMGAPNG